jgi:hypothetical protein
MSPEMPNASGQEPVPDWQKDELAKRKAEFLQDPSSAIPWEGAERIIADEHD